MPSLPHRRGAAQDRNLSRAASMLPESGAAYDFMVVLLYEMKLGHRAPGR